MKFDHQAGKPTNELEPEVVSLLQTMNSKATNVSDACQESNVLTYIQKCVDAVNEKAISRVNKIKKWRILDRDFSIEGGELTPTMKVKRKYIAKKYEELID